MDNTRNPHREVTSQPIVEDTAVYDVNGDKVGEVSDHGMVAGTLVVRQGLFFPTELYIPLDAIRAHDAESVRLSVTKDEIRLRHWDQAPMDLPEEYAADEAPDEPTRADSPETADTFNTPGLQP